MLIKAKKSILAIVIRPFPRQFLISTNTVVRKILTLTSKNSGRTRAPPPPPPPPRGRVIK